MTKYQQTVKILRKMVGGYDKMFDQLLGLDPNDGRTSIATYIGQYFISLCLTDTIIIEIIQKTEGKKPNFDKLLEFVETSPLRVDNLVSWEFNLADPELEKKAYNVVDQCIRFAAKEKNNQRH